MKEDKLIKQFLKKIKPLRKYIEEIYLFGSRARGNYSYNSDYDILIITKEKNRELIDRLYEAVIDILISTGKLISLKIFTVSEYERLKSLSTPFIRNITKEGVRIG